MGDSDVQCHQNVRPLTACSRGSSESHSSTPVSLFLFVALSFSVVTLAGSSHAADNRVFPANAIERHTNWLQYKAYTHRIMNSIHCHRPLRIRRFRTQHGFIWFGVNSSGLVRFDGHQMESYGFDDGVPSLLLNNMTLGPNGHLWISTKAGLVVSSPMIDNSATSSVSFRKTVVNGERKCSRRIRCAAWRRCLGH